LKGGTKCAGRGKGRTSISQNLPRRKKRLQSKTGQKKKGKLGKDADNWRRGGTQNRQKKTPGLKKEPARVKKKPLRGKRTPTFKA